MRLFGLVSLLIGLFLLLRSECGVLVDSRRTRRQEPPSVRPRGRPSPRDVHQGRGQKASARLGSDQRADTESERRAGRVHARLCAEEAHGRPLHQGQCVPSLRRASPRLLRRRMQGSRRQLLGDPGVEVLAAVLRLRPLALVPGRCRLPHLPLDRAARAVGAVRRLDRRWPRRHRPARPDRTADLR